MNTGLGRHTLLKDDMEQSHRVKRYFDLLCLPLEDTATAHKAALNRAHELRKFEIENYWKRSSYFWGFQLVAFGAVALIAKGGKFDPPLVLIVSVLGGLTALTGVLSARGSKFWQANWEAHVDFLEATVEGHLHTTALAATSLQYSVSRLNERLLEVILAGWLLAFMVAAAVLVAPQLLTLQPSIAAAWQIGVTGCGFGLGAIHLIRGQRSKLRGRAYRLSDFEPLG